MEKKMHGWKEGLLSKDLKSAGGTILKKGSIVRYKRCKTIPNKDGFKLTEYEWHYLDENNFNLIRTLERIIDGLPNIKEVFKMKTIGNGNI